MLKNTVLFSLALLTSSLYSAEVGKGSNAPKTVQSAPTTYQAKNYASLLGTMRGFSDALLKMHFQLYEGYVKNCNLLLATLQDLNKQEGAATYEFGALKRRLGWEFDGMRLHEFYFDNLGGRGEINQNNLFYQRILKDFGSFEEWKKDFVSTGLIRGIGWVILYRDPTNGRLINTWINEHDLGHLAGGDPLLVMDVFEHAYITQYGLDRAQYINAFFESIRWDIVSKRFTDATKRQY